MHPNKLFDEVGCRTGIDTFETFDKDLQNKLKNVHPMNFIKSRLEFPVYKIKASYLTDHGNYKEVEKFAILNNLGEDEYSDFWIDMFMKDFEERNPKHKIHDLEIISVEKICDAVLPIG